MCKYCEEQKRLEERENDNIHFEIYGKHLRVIGKLPILDSYRRSIIVCKKKYDDIRWKKIKYIREEN